MICCLVLCRTVSSYNKGRDVATQKREGAAASKGAAGSNKSAPELAPKVDDRWQFVYVRYLCVHNNRHSNKQPTQTSVPGHVIFLLVAIFISFIYRTVRYNQILGYENTVECHQKRRMKAYLKDLIYASGSPQ